MPDLTTRAFKTDANSSLAHLILLLRFLCIPIYAAELNNPEDTKYLNLHIYLTMVHVVQLENPWMIDIHREAIFIILQRCNGTRNFLIFKSTKLRTTVTILHKNHSRKCQYNLFTR